MKKIKVGINGFGRIGRLLVRIISKKENMEIVAINKPNLNLEYAKYLFEHDTIHGKFDGKVETGKDCLIINGQKIKILGEREPKDIPWGKIGVDYVCDATGVFKTKEALGGHLLGGAKKVVITAPADKDIPMIIYGINEETYTKDISIVSNASCTTNCLAPLAKVIEQNFGIEEGLMTTIHSATSSQKVVDGTSEKDFRGGRAASYNIIPSSTGAAKAVGEVLPNLKGKLTGMSFRVPTLNVSVVDLTCKLKKETTYEEIVKVMKKAENGKFKGIIGTTDEPVVSSDFITEDRTCVFDITAGIMLSPKFVKLVAWYDNEWGYSQMVVKLVEHMAKIDAKK
ncbi:MAG: type I glyceraldehyde-3-phosphate dehydrogenase [Clostridia bacterium]|nr:type I glyceraldehyde-3-phosphate dehydrogenase [Clostridia bacterium]